MMGVIGRSRHGNRRREGYVLVWFALALAVLLGMVGLVIDAGFLMAHHRHVQNAADSAATAAAMHLLRRQPIADATTVAVSFVHDHNGLPDATVEINFPPSQGPYATGGIGTYVEAIVTDSINTFLIHLLPGIAQSQTVSARAVAGFEAVTAGEGVMVLDPTAIPGLNVGGQGVIRVNGRVVVNSEGGGVDEFGEPVDTGNNGVAASAGQPNSPNGIFAVSIDVVGGVDSPELFKPYNPGDPSPLTCRQPPEPDPLIELPIPTVGRGVDPTRRGYVTVTNNGVKGVEEDEGGLNYVAEGGESPYGGYVATAGEAIIYPGIYDKIAIEGGKAFFVPGIYVLAAQTSNQDVLKITGGEVTCDGSMFYVTGDNYDPTSGWPDTTDGEFPPPAPDGALLGRVTINAEMHFSPIDVGTYTYHDYNSTVLLGPMSRDYDGMLFFQRRRNPNKVTIVGNSEYGELSGTIYAKWANFEIAGQGAYDAQFIVGSISVTGQGDVTILAAGGNKGKANQVFLVE